MNLHLCYAWLRSETRLSQKNWLTGGLSFFYVKDIQAEIDAHNDIYKSVDGNKSKMVKALGSSEEAVFLQHRLDDMNQRWSDLKAKSASIRSVRLWANT